MFLRNVWYVAAWSAELVAGTPLARMILGQPVVLFRTAAGTVAALEDRCSHRAMPLSSGGECEGDLIRCPYHGLEFDTSGSCVRIPGQDHIPEQTHIRSYPVVDRDALIWIWMGEPSIADAATITPYPFHTSNEWVWTFNELEIEANWLFFNDNLLDLSHLGFVHKRTIGGDPDAHSNAETKATREGDHVFLRRWILNSEPPPFYRPMNAWKGKIDRWQEVEFVPGLLRFYTGGTDAGTGAYEGRRIGGVHIRHMHGITPQTEHSTRYFFTQARNFKISDDELTQKMHASASATFLEDKAVLEAQYRRVRGAPERELLNIRSDAAGALARRVVSDLYEKENTRPHATL